MDNIQERADDYILVKLQMVADEKLGECGFKDDLQLAIDEIKRMRRDYASLLSANAELSFKNMKLKEFMDWAKRIIDSGMGAGILRYNPVQFFIEYHTYLKSLEESK